MIYRLGHNIHIPMHVIVTPILKLVHNDSQDGRETTFYTSHLVYWNGFGSFFAACHAMSRQLPFPLQSLGHFIRSHALPVYPSRQVHIPLTVLQIPMLLHSVRACAVSVAVALSAHASPFGQRRSLQSPPLQSSQHTHLTREDRAHRREDNREERKRIREEKIRQQREERRERQREQQKAQNRAEKITHRVSPSDEHSPCPEHLFGQ